MKITTADTNMSNYTKYKEYLTFLNSNIDEIITDLLAELKTYNGLDKILITGYTPSFNDGDPCEHWSTAYFEDFSEVADWHEHNDWLGLPEDCDEPYDYVEENPINSYDMSKHKEIETIVGHLELLVKEKYDTNFIIKVDLTGEKAVLTKDYYDCGY